MRHRVDHGPCHHFLSEPPSGPPRLPCRSLATREGDHMGFCISGGCAPVGMGHRLALPSSCTTFCNQTLLERLAFFGGDCIRSSHVGVGPTTGSIILEENIGVKNRTALGLVLGENLSSYRLFGVCQVHGLSAGHSIALTWRLKGHI